MIPPLHGMLECRSLNELKEKFPKVNDVTARTIMTLVFQLIPEWKREVVDGSLSVFDALKYTKLTNEQQLELWNQAKGL